MFKVDEDSPVLQNSCSKSRKLCDPAMMHLVLLQSINLHQAESAPQRPDKEAVETHPKLSEVRAAYRQSSLSCRQNASWLLSMLANGPALQTTASQTRAQLTSTPWPSAYSSLMPSLGTCETTTEWPAACWGLGRALLADFRWIGGRLGRLCFPAAQRKQTSQAIRPWPTRKPANAAKAKACRSRHPKYEGMHHYKFANASTYSNTAACRQCLSSLSLRPALR